jgi:hypothetical protein
LGSLTPTSGPAAWIYRFYDLQPQGTIQQGESFAGNETAGTSVFGDESSGFSVVSSSWDWGAGAVARYSSDGHLIQQVQIAASHDRLIFPATTARHPGGGVSNLFSIRDQSSCTTIYQRADLTRSIVSNTTIDIISSPDPRDEPVLPSGLAINHQGHALAFLTRQVNSRASVQARWLGSNGETLSGWFDVPADHYALAQLLEAHALIDESIAIRSQPGKFVAVIGDQRETATDAPGWLASVRPFARFYVIRGRGGYATWDLHENCIHLLTPDGRTCGCLVVPGYLADATIGIDGSLIVPVSGYGDTQACTYALYPRLFK